MMIKKLFLSFALFLFFTNIFCMKRELEITSIVPTTESREDKNIDKITPSIVSKSLSHELLTILRETMLDFNLNLNDFLFTYSPGKFITFDQKRMVVDINDFGIAEFNQFEWAASFIAAYINRFIKTGKKPFYADVFSETYSYLLNQEKFTGIIHRISALATMIVMNQTMKIITKELTFIQTYLNQHGYIVTFSLSKNSVENIYLLISTIKKNNTYSNFQRAQILPKIPDQSNIYKAQLVLLQETKAPEVKTFCTIL